MRVHYTRWWGRKGTTSEGGKGKPREEKDLESVKWGGKDHEDRERRGKV